MKRVAVSPEEVAKSLRAIVRDASDERFLAEYKDAHELAYPAPSGSRFEGGSRGAIAYSDPTLNAFDQDHEPRGMHQPGCAAYVEDPELPDCYEPTGKPCDCSVPKNATSRSGGLRLRPDLERNRSAALEVARQVDVAQKAMGAAKRQLELLAGRKLFGRVPDPPELDRKAFISEKDWEQTMAAKARREGARGA